MRWGSSHQSLMLGGAKGLKAAGAGTQQVQAVLLCVPRLVVSAAAGQRAWQLFRRRVEECSGRGLSARPSDALQLPMGDISSIHVRYL